jgi:protein SHQ1
MITPRFSCNQDERSVIISVYCPAIRASEVEINVDDTLFTLHVNPYFLRLNFTNSLLEDDKSSAKYDPRSAYLTVTLTKAVVGQVFDDLDLLAKLLAPRPSEPQPGPSIEVINSKENFDDIASLSEQAKALSLEDTQFLEGSFPLIPEL